MSRHGHLEGFFVMWMLGGLGYALLDDGSVKLLCDIADGMQ